MVTDSFYESFCSVVAAMKHVLLSFCLSTSMILCSYSLCICILKYQNIAFPTSVNDVAKIAFQPANLRGKRLNLCQASVMSPCSDECCKHRFQMDGKTDSADKMDNLVKMSRRILSF